MRTPPVSFGTSFILATTVATLIACSDSGGTGPSDGSIRVTTQSGGIGTDPDGYFVRLDSTTEGPIGDQTPLVLTSISAGAHTVALDSVASFCEVVGGASRTVVVHGGETADVNFNVTCRSTGGLKLRTMAVPRVEARLPGRPAVERDLDELPYFASRQW